jgi:tRNA threonylcarbamoyladenosine biosynthesis protein TsaB
MKLLGLDSSAVSASCAVCEICENGDCKKILAQGSVNVKITHSQTLIPLMENMLKSAGLTLSDIDCFAVSNGPGSFTGLRIAVSAVKGMAFALNKPVCGVSTLESLAYNLCGNEVIVCAVMDARRNEVYNALFCVNGESVTRLTPDRAISLDELQVELEQYADKKVVLVGDGAELASTQLTVGDVATAAVRFQNAVSVCFAVALEKSEVSATLSPKYLRKPQAEREREEREVQKS